MSYTNLDYLKEFTDDDPELIKEAVTRYLNKSPVLLEELNEGYEQRDWKKVAFAAHTLYGATQIVGMEGIGKELKKIENMATDNQDVREIERNIRQVNIAVEASFGELNDL